MADTSDVEAAIVQILGGIIYPIATSAVGISVNIERGWPTEADIRNAVGAGMALVRVHAVSGLNKDLTRFPRDWVDSPESSPTMLINQSDYNLVFTGTPAVGQFVGISQGSVGYAYPVQSGDTLAGIASNIASNISGATASLTTVTMPSGPIPQATVQNGGDSSVEAGRGLQDFSIVTWAPTPQTRDTIMRLIYPAMANAYRIVLDTGEVAVLMDLEAAGPDDVPSRANEWRRDLRACYDFPVTFTQYFAPAVVIDLDFISEQVFIS